MSIDIIAILILATIAGFAFGSFINVVILRLHNKKKGIITGRSECPKCKHQLGAKDLIPIISFLWLRGKCRYCSSKIPYDYLFMEIATGLLWFIVTYYSMFHILYGNIFAFFYFLIFANILFIISVYDIRYMEIPSILSFPFILLFIIFLFHPFTISPENGIYGALVVFGFFYLQILIPYFIYAVKKKNYSILKTVFILPFWFVSQIFSPHNWTKEENIEEKDDTPKDLVEWIGFGDLRIGFFIGLVLGIKFSVIALFVSYILGAIWGVFVLAKKKDKSKNIIPFGPFLTIGAFLTYLYGGYMLSLYYLFGDFIRSLVL